MMMAIKPVRLDPIQPTELIELHGDDILEVTDEPRIKDDAGEWVPLQVCAKSALPFEELPGTNLCGEWRGKVEVQAGVDSPLADLSSGSFRVVHKNHGADGRNSTANEALRYPFGSLIVASPIVSVDDKKTGLR